MLDALCNGVRLSYEVVGAGDAVVLVGGTNMPPVIWELGLAPALVDAGYQVISFANRGTQPSDAPPAPYTVSEMADDTAALIETIGVGPCHLVGYSLGGFVAEELCYRRPDLSRDVVLMASIGRATSFVKANAQAEVDLAMALDPQPTTQMIRDTLLLVQPVAALQHDETIEPMRTMMEAAPPWTNPGRLGQRSAVLAWVNDEQRVERWPQLTQRCLALAFEHDMLWPPDRATDATSTMPNATTTVIAGAAHGGLLTHPDDVGRAVVTFLRAG